MNLDYHETAINFDHEQGLVHVYTTRQDVYEGFLSRGVRPLRHKRLQPGYELVYEQAKCQDPSLLLNI